MILERLNRRVQVYLEEREVEEIAVE